jgi:nucleotide-binding universal stress UspA family protein
VSEEPSKTSILIPLSKSIEFSEFVSSVVPLLRFRNPSITLFHVIEAPVTSSLEPEAMNGVAKEFIEWVRPVVEWFEQQKYDVSVKTAVARSIPDAIVEETRVVEYSFVFMLKRRRVGLRGHFSRSITQQVTEQSRIPVISVLV